MKINMNVSSDLKQISYFLMNVFFLIFFLFLLILVFYRKYQEMTSGVERIDIETFKLKAKDKDVIILDVRTPNEFKSVNIKGAMNIDITSSDFKNNIAGLDKNKTYLIYCQAGTRSTRASKILRKEGFTNLYNFTGGMSEWKRKKNILN